MNTKIFKGISLAVTVIGMGLTLISSWADEKVLDATIEEKVKEAVENKK